MRVRLLRDWMNRTKGTLVNVPERVARDLIRRGTAVFDDPELLGKSDTYKKATRTTKK